MADKVVKLLITDPEGVYVDLTAGAGGHLKALADALGPGARLYGVDKDPTAVELAKKKLAGYKQVRGIVRGSYREMETIAERIGEMEFNGAMMDLGLLSDQLDDSARGFSFSHEGPLDMRFDVRSDLPTAADLINTLDERRLTEIIRNYGEERMAPQLARAIVMERQKGVIETTGQLAHIVKRTVRPPRQIKALARVFQAFRIAVNRELEELEAALPKVFELLKVNGRMAVISYHSLEDRIVKRFFQREAKGCVCPPELPVCACGRVPRVRILTKKALVPDDAEKERNPRSRSAKLRVAEKIAA
jgi:16S rRNA (cytosine1402-N4)-methyltransferase